MYTSALESEPRSQREVRSFTAIAFLRLEHFRHCGEFVEMGGATTVCCAVVVIVEGKKVWRGRTFRSSDLKGLLLTNVIVSVTAPGGVASTK
mmetsp:Transcript_31123/g.68343  ORF Transcript_31123/g.68343 Transcript_31123/m.68343 type:complete len:92 (-) Transcript_31123:688-963(-)